LAWAEINGLYPHQVAPNPDLAIKYDVMNLLFAGLHLGRLEFEVGKIARASVGRVKIVDAVGETPPAYYGSTTKYFTMSAVIHVGYFTAGRGVESMQRMLLEHDWDTTGTGSDPNATVVTSDLTRGMCGAAQALHTDRRGIRC
jgi:hypothetical protein